MEKKLSLTKDQIGEILKEAPDFVAKNLQFLAVTGSHAYGCATPESDLDLVGFTVPPHKYLWPGHYGLISGFDEMPVFEVFQKTHIETSFGKFDVSIYGLPKFFLLCEQCNPNIIDVLFSPDNCVVVESYAAKYIREHRKLFLSRRAYPRFLGYSLSQREKALNGAKDAKPSRKALVEKYGYDTKHTSHLYRLLREGIQILDEGNLEVDKWGSTLSDIRAGLISREELFDSIFPALFNRLDEVYLSSKLQDKPDHDKVRNLLVEALDICARKA